MFNVSFGSHRPDWSQALREAASHVHTQEQPVAHFADASSAESEYVRVYDPRRLSVIAARAGALRLARHHASARGVTSDGGLLVAQLAMLAHGAERAGGASSGIASSSSGPPSSVSALGSRLAMGDMSALPSLLGLVQQVAQHARDAAEASLTGAMAAFVSAGDTRRENVSMLTTRIANALAHIDELEFAVDAAGEDDDNDNETSPIREARLQLLEARTALGTLHGDLVHCLVQQTIGEHRLSAEAAVFGEVAALRQLRPAAFEIEHGGGDPRVFEGMAELASRVTRDLRALLGAADEADRTSLATQVDRGTVGVREMITNAADAVAVLRSACPQGATQEALGELFDALGETRTWVDHGRTPHASTMPTVPPHSPLRSPPTPNLASVSASVGRERIEELARQRVALGQLPQIVAHTRRSMRHTATEARINREINDRIASTISGAIGPHTPVGMRTELARVAMHFVVGDAVERNRLARRLTSAVLDVPAPTRAEVVETVGGADAAALWAVALFDRLGDILAGLSPTHARRFVRSIGHEYTVADGGVPYASVRRAAEAVASRRLVGQASLTELALPEGTAWLASNTQRRRWASSYVELCGATRGDHARHGDGHVDNHTAFLPLIALASDFEKLRGYRHHFVDFVKHLFELDDEHAGRRYRPAAGSAQRFALLQAMVLQLPQFGTAAGDKQTVSDVLSLVFRQLDGGALKSHHKARLVKDLLTITGQLSASRFSPSGAAQSYALDAIKAGLRHLRGQELVMLLQHLLVSSESWDTGRSASGQLPRTRGQKLSFALSSILPPLGVVGAATYATRTAIGRDSPRQEALRLVLDTLEQRLDRGQEASTGLIPVYAQVLRQIFASAGQTGGKLDKRHLSRALSCIVRGGLPIGGDVSERNKFISDVLGDDPALRAAVARVLTRVVSERAGPAKNPLARLSAGRYLQNLIAAGAGSLDQTEVQAAQAAIDRAVSSRSVDAANPEQQAVLEAMLREAQRDGMPIQRGLVQRTAEQTIARLRSAVAPGDVAAAAPHMPLLVSSYSLFDARTREALKEALLGSLPAAPEPHGTAAAQRQLPLLAFATGLSRFAGNSQDATELLQLLERAWPRLNPTNQEAAISDMFSAFDEATPAGRDVVRKMVSMLGEPGQFVSGAIKLIENTVADERMRTKMSDEESSRMIDAVLARIRDLPAANTSDLVSNVMAHGDRLPHALVDGFVGAARKLHTRVLAQVLGSELARMAVLPPDETAAVLGTWRNAHRRIPLDSEQRDTLRLFATIAEEVFPHLGSEEGRTERIAVPPDAATQLLGALPTFTPQLQAVVLRHIAGDGAPAEIRKAVVDDLFSDFATADASRRQLAMQLGGAGAVGRGLHALAKEFGVPRPAALGGATRPGLDQPIALPRRTDRGNVIEQQTLQSALSDPARRPEEISVVLEAMAENFLGFRKEDHQVHFERLIDTLFARLPRHLQARVMDTLVLANPSLMAMTSRDNALMEVTEVGQRVLRRHGSPITPRVGETLGALNAFEAEMSAHATATHSLSGQRVNVPPVDEVKRSRLRQAREVLLQELRNTRFA